MITYFKIIGILCLEWLLVSLAIFFVTYNIFISLILGAILFFGVIFGFRALHQKYRVAKIEKMKTELPKKVFSLQEDGHVFRDLNKNGKLDIYEDSRQPIEKRVDDLLSQMNVAEKAGLLFNHFTFVEDADHLMTRADRTYNTYPEEMIFLKNMNTFTFLGGTNSPKKTALISNKLQELAERTRLGIPVTIASDPRHHYDARVGFGAAQEGISTWPEQLGLAATRDLDLVEKFGNIARQEYRAQGIHVILGPMADTATSPMWGRNYGTFGDDYKLVSEMTVSLIKGMQQGRNISPESVACQVKHFPGGGPEKDGWDSHFPYGREQIYPNDKFREHLEPFVNAIDSGVSQVMPYYSLPEGLEGIEEVGFNFNKQIISDLLRDELKFDGVVGTDFSIIKGTKILGFNLLFPKVWGVEKLTPKQRLKKAYDAGVDQIGGDTCVNLLIELINEEQISIKRINESCKRVLRDKFKLGLFDKPFVDVNEVENICGKESFVEAGLDAQRKSLVLLKNGQADKSILPLKKGISVYVENVSKDKISKYAKVVENPEDADIAIIRRDSPYRKQYKYLYEKLFKQGALNFSKKEKQSILNIINKVPTILDVGLDRLVVFDELADQCDALTGHFGCEEEVFIGMIFGEFKPTGKLPYSLPKNMDVVYAHKVDTPLSKEDALFEYGFGLTYK